MSLNVCERVKWRNENFSVDHAAKLSPPLVRTSEAVPLWELRGHALCGSFT